MSNVQSYRDKKVVMEMIAAYVLYLENGMDAVARMYPQHVSFVQSQKGKSRTEVKNELLHRQAA